VLVGLPAEGRHLGTRAAHDHKHGRLWIVLVIVRDSRSSARFTRGPTSTRNSKKRSALFFLRCSVSLWRSYFSDRRGL